MRTEAPCESVWFERTREDTQEKKMLLKQHWGKGDGPQLSARAYAWDAEGPGLNP